MTNSNKKQPLEKTSGQVIAMNIFAILGCLSCGLSFWGSKLVAQHWGILWGITAFILLILIGAQLLSSRNLVSQVGEYVRFVPATILFIYAGQIKGKRKLQRLTSTFKLLDKFRTDKHFSKRSDAYKQIILDWISRLHFELYKITFNQQNLETALEFMEVVTANQATFMEYRANQLNFIGQLHWHKYKQSANIVWLDKATEYCSKAVDSANLPSAKAGYIHDVANALHDRFEYTNNFEELEKAVKLSKLVLDVTPEKSGRLPDYQYLYAICLVSRYSQKTDPNDFAEARNILDNLLKRKKIESILQSNTLLALGRAYDIKFEVDGVQNDIEQAIMHLQEASKTSYVNPNDQAVILLSLGASLLKYGHLVNSIDHIEKGINFNKKASNLAFKDSDIHAGALANIGEGFRLLYEQTNDPLALANSENALRQAKKLIPENHIRNTVILLNLGVTLIDSYKISGTLIYLDEAKDALETALQIGSLTSDIQARAYSNLGAVFQELYYRSGKLSDFNDALNYIQLATNTSNKTSAYYHVMVNNLASSLRLKFDITGEVTDLQQALFLINNSLSSDNVSDWNRALLHANFALVQRDIYYHSRDIVVLNQAIEAAESAVTVSSSQSPLKSKFLAVLGMLLMMRYAHNRSQEDYDSAITLMSQSLTLISPKETTYIDVLFEIGVAQNLLAWSDRNEQNIEASLKIFREMEETISQKDLIMPETLKFLGFILSDRYWLRGDVKDLDKAVEYLQKACEQGIMPQGVLESAERWAHISSGRSDWTTTLTALTYAWNAIDDLFKIQSLRSSKIFWLERSQNIPANLAFSQAKCGDFRKAVEILEQGRARLLAETQELARQDLKRLSDLGHSSLLQNYESILQRIASFNKIFAMRQLTPINSSYYADIQTLKKELDECIERIRAIPGFSDFLISLNFFEIQKTVILNNKIGVYLCVSDYGGLALIVHSNGVIPVWFDLTTANAKSLIASNYIMAQDEPLAFRSIIEKMLSEVGERIVKPIFNALKQNNLIPSSIVLIPTGQLNLLPLHAAEFILENEVTSLITKFPVHYVPSVKALLHSENSLDQFLKQKTKLLAVGQLLPSTQQPLKYADLEINAVSSYFLDNVVLSNVEASLSAIFEMLQGSSYVHFTCHGYFNVYDPLESGLILDSIQKLTLKDLIGLNHKNIGRLVILSACQTGIPEHERIPEESIGLPSGFLQIGFAGTVGTLWSVHDLSTALLMIAFYRFHMNELLKPAEALQKAQLWLRDLTNKEISTLFNTYRRTAHNTTVVQTLFRKYTLENPQEKPFSHPYFWAPFIMYGI